MELSLIVPGAHIAPLTRAFVACCLADAVGFGLEQAIERLLHDPAHDLPEIVADLQSSLCYYL